MKIKGRKVITNNMKNLLILGGNGFAGKNLCEYFGQFPSEYSVASPNSTELDLLDENKVTDYLRRGSFDVVINAAICNTRRSSYVQNSRELDCDLRMYYNLERCSDMYGKMLYFGSGAEYDKRFPICSVTEKDIGRSIPVTDYGLAKYIIGKSIDQSRNVYNLRIFGLYGKYENYGTTFISGACCKALKGLPITIRQNVYFDYLYIADFCKIVKHFIDNDVKYHTYNIVSGSRIDLMSIAQLVKEVCRASVPIYVCCDGLANEYTASNLRLLEEIREFKYSDFTDCIEDLVGFYRGIIDQINILNLLYQ